MKKILSLIYRLCFIIFSLWGLIEYAAVNRNISGFAPIVTIACLASILAVFIFTLKGKGYRLLFNIKYICTLLSLILLITNFNIISSFFVRGWVLYILLPIMMLLDWLLFDKKGVISPADFIIWIISVAAILFLLDFLFGHLPILSDIVNLLRNPKTLLPIIAGIGLIAALMYLLDALLGGKSLLPGNIFLKIIYIAAEIYCFTGISLYSLNNFIGNLKYYSLFINFLSFLCVTVILIRSLFVRSSKNNFLLLRIKACLATSGILLPIFFGIYNDTLWGGKAYCILLCIVCPVLLIADCFLYDRRFTYKAYDPVLWIVIPILHFILTYFILRPYFSLNTYSNISYNAFLLLGSAIFLQIIVGYILYFMNKLKK